MSRSGRSLTVKSSESERSLEFTEGNGQPVLVSLSKVTAEHLPDFDCLDEATSATIHLGKLRSMTCICGYKKKLLFNKRKHFL